MPDLIQTVWKRGGEGIRYVAVCVGLVMAMMLENCERGGDGGRLPAMGGKRIARRPRKMSLEHMMDG